MIDESSVHAALIDALPSAKPVTSLDRILAGWGNVSFLADTALGRLVCKVALPGVDPAKYRASAAGLAAARDAGVPGPELLAFVDSVDGLDGRIFRVFRHLDGVTPSIDVPLSTFRDLGSAMRRLHSLDVAGFTPRFGERGFPRWSEFLEARWPAVMERATKAAIDPAALARARAVSNELAAEVDDVVTPAVCHRDLYLDNLLVDAEGAFVALLDFDILEVWDPAVEQMKLEWFIFERNPAAREAWFDGYLGGDPMPPKLAERVRLASIIELVNHIAGWRLNDDTELDAEALDRLRVLLVK